MSAVNATASNLRNVERQAGSRVTTLQVTAKILGLAPLETYIRFDLLENQGDFTFGQSASDVNLTRANQLSRAYAGLELSSGHGDFTMQLQAKDWQLCGYAKPLFHDLQIFT
jgi:hypothetical protein